MAGQKTEPFSMTLNNHYHSFQGHAILCSRSLQMAPFDRPYTTLYWSAILNIALSCSVFKLSISDLTLNNSTPPLGEGVPVWCGRTRMVGLSDGEKNFEDMYNLSDRILACDYSTSSNWKMVQHRAILNWPIEL